MPIVAGLGVLDPDLWVRMEGFVLIALAVLAVGGLVLYLQYRHRQAMEASLGELIAREPGLAPTTAPVGLAADQYAATFTGCPRGDRRYGLRWAVQGPLPVALADDEVRDGRDIPCAAFEWWWEERRQSTDSKGNTTTSYTTRRTIVAAARLPHVIPDHVHVGPESVFGRLGLSRRDHQLESDAFNRQFRVVAEDRLLTVQLFDAALQQRLLDSYTGRTIEFSGDLLVVAGDPGRRDASLRGCIGRLPPAREDVRRLLESVPAQFWRAVARRT